MPHPLFSAVDSRPVYDTARTSIFRMIAERHPEASRSISTSLLPPRKGRSDPSAMMMIGRRGRGKTLLMTAFAADTKQRYQAYRYPGRIFSNYWIDDGICDRYDPFILDLLADPDYDRVIRNGTICLDEIQSAASSRRSMSKGNVFLSQYLTQMRKNRLAVMYTTQFPQVIDYQVLLQTDYFVRCEALENGYGNIIGVLAFVFDWWGADTGKDYRKSWPPPKEQADWIWPFFGVQQMFGRYDTDQRSPSAYLDDDVRARMIESETGGRGHVVSSWDEVRSVEEMDDLRREWQSAAVVDERDPSDALVALLPHGSFNTMGGPLNKAKAAFGDVIMNQRTFEDELRARGYRIELEGTKHIAVPGEAAAG